MFRCQSRFDDQLSGLDKDQIGVSNNLATNKNCAIFECHCNEMIIPSSIPKFFVNLPEISILCSCTTISVMLFNQSLIWWQRPFESSCTVAIKGISSFSLLD